MTDYYRWAKSAIDEDPELDEVPYLPEHIVGSIDNMYYLMHSGDKFISPYLSRCIAHEYPSPTGWRVLVGKDLATLYHGQLMKEWERFAAEYDPAANYSVKEIVDYDHSGSSGMSDSGTDTKLRSGVIQNYGKMHSKNTANTYDAVNADTTTNETWSEENRDPSTTRYGTGAEGSGLSDATTYGKTRRSNESGHDDLTTTKTGNLGITPVAQLLQMDIELWKLNFYRDIMFPLFDKTLVLPIY